LHAAQTAGGAPLYLPCGQISVTGGGGGTLGLVAAFPGALFGHGSWDFGRYLLSIGEYFLHGYGLTFCSKSRELTGKDNSQQFYYTWSSCIARKLKCSASGAGIFYGALYDSAKVICEVHEPILYILSIHVHKMSFMARSQGWPIMEQALNIEGPEVCSYNSAMLASMRYCTETTDTTRIGIRDPNIRPRNQRDFEELLHISIKCLRQDFFGLTYWLGPDWLFSLLPEAAVS
jgi:hypothetical protein